MKAELRYSPRSLLRPGFWLFRLTSLRTPAWGRAYYLRVMGLTLTLYPGYKPLGRNK